MSRRFPHHRPRLGEPAGGQLYPVHAAALVSKHFKTPHQIAETLLFPIEIKAGEIITSDYFIPGLPWGSGLIYGGLERQARSGTRIYPVYALEEMLNEIGE